MYSGIIEEGVLSILTNAVCVKCIPNLLGEIQSKNGAVRACISEYISIVMETYPDEILERYVEPLSKAIKKCLADADPIARNHSRNSLNFLSEKFGDEYRKIINSLDATTKKQLSTVVSTQEIRDERPVSPKTQLKTAKKTELKRANSSKEDNDSHTKDTDMDESKKTPISNKNRTVSSVKNKPPQSSKGIERTSEKPSVKTEKSISVKKPATGTTGILDRKSSIPKAGISGIKERPSVKSIERDSEKMSVKTDKTKTDKKVKGKGEGSHGHAELKEAIGTLDNSQWNERLNGLKRIEKYLSDKQDLNQHSLIPEEILSGAIEKISERFEDQHAKVQEGALKLINVCYPSFKNVVSVHLSSLLLKVRTY
jgi:hypothetical protein